MEEETMCQYSKPCGNRTTQEGYTMHYRCFRSGTERHNSHDERISRKDSMKINAYCPSRIKALVAPQGKVEVQFCSTHIGHDNSIEHLRLTKTQRANLAAKIRDGVSIDTIMDELEENLLNGLQRKYIVERKDLMNIIQEFKLDKTVVHKNDAFSVDLWVQGQRKNGEYDMVLFYKAQGCEDWETYLDDRDFMIVLMTKYQEELLLRFGTEKILIDSTHGTTEYDFQLTTLMTVDEYGAGFPGAFCISNRIDSTAMKIFFDAVKKRTGVITTEVFMSDDAPAYYNAWVLTMGSCKHQLLCSWHVDRAWRTQTKLKVKGSVKAAEVYKGCRVLLDCPDEEIFPDLMKGFINMCKSDPDTLDFGNYFEEKYSGRAELWAMCKRKGIGLTTNMYLEALHKTIKYIFLDGRKNRRVDKLVAALVKLCRRLMVQRIIRYVKKKPSSRMEAITARHKRHGEVKETMIAMTSANKWRVQSSELTRGPYEVEIFPGKICDNCPLNCPVCKLCVHQISCSCLDYQFRLSFCKHAHACIMTTHIPEATPKRNFTADEKLQGFESVAAQSSNLTDDVSAETKFSATMERIKGLAMQLKPEEMEEACKGADKFMTHLMKIVNSREVNHAEPGLPEFDNAPSQTPHNKKVEKQLRFKSTKRLSLSRRTAETALTKPGDIQREVLTQVFLNSFHQDKEFISIQSQQDSDHHY